MDDRKDEDVVAVLLDEPTPEGQFKSKFKFFFLLLNLLKCKIMSQQAHADIAQVQFRGALTEV